MQESSAVIGAKVLSLSLASAVQRLLALKYSHFVAVYETREDEHGVAVKQTVYNFFNAFLNEVST